MSDQTYLKALRDLVNAGKVMQLATIDGESPWLCHVWYAVDWPRNSLLFTSNIIRNHSKHIEKNSRVAGAILAQELTSLGQKVQGVTFTGNASAVSNDQLDHVLPIFLARWPTDALEASKIKSGLIPNKLYRVTVDLWILHDELNFPDSPRFEWHPEN